MASTPGAHDIDVSSLWSSLRKALPGLMVLTIVSGVITFVGLGFVAPRYGSEAQLTITAKASSGVVDKDDQRAAATITPRLDREAINTHVRAIAAPDLLLAVSRELNLESRAEFNGAIGPVDTVDHMMRLVGLGRPHPSETTEQRVLDALQESITVYAARESRFISVNAVSTSPDVAAGIVNAIAETYRRSLREIPVRETNEAVEALLPKIDELRREVLQAEAAAKRFRAETNQLTSGTGAATLEQQRLAALSADLSRAESEEARAEAKLRAAQDQSGRGAQSLAEVQQSKVIQDLITERVRVERQVNEARAVLLPAHPRMRQLSADLAGIERALNAEVENIVVGIRKEREVSRLRTEELRAQIDALKRRAIDNSANEARLRALEANATAKRNELERLQKQLEDSRTVVDTARVPVEATIVSRGRPEGEPVFPRKGPAALLVMAATLMLGMALVAVKELMIPASVPHNRRSSDKRNAARGLIRETAEAPAKERPAPPTAAARSLSRHAQPAAPPPSAPPVRIRDVARTFNAAKSSEGGFRILVASAANDIDPSDEAIELANEMSELGARVVIVDWSLDGAVLFGEIDTLTAGTLVDLLTDAVDFSDIVVPLADANVHYIRASREPVPADVFDEVGLNLVLDALDEAYDQIVVVGRRDDARTLFETIQGRFDAGVAVHDSGHAASLSGFLGFEVEGLEVVQFVRNPAPVPVEVRA